MSRWAADALWGEDLVGRALAEPEPEPVTVELARAVETLADPDDPDAEAVLRGMTNLPWRRFCAVVRLVAGVTREELLDG